MMASISIPTLALYARERAKVFRDAVGRIAAYSFEHLLFLGGLAAIAYGGWMIWHPLGPILGGWFAVQVAKLISLERK